jgi:adenylate kinase
MIIFLGLAGSGKSTQSQLLAKKLSCPWLSTGQMLRDTITDSSIKKRMLEGEVLDDSLMLPLLDEQLKRLAANEFILDGSPRTLNQAKWLVEKIKYHGINLTAVIHLEASKDEVRKRLLKRGRQDDTETAIEERFREYEKTIIPILNYLRQNNLPVYDIDGQQDPDLVDSNILSVLKPNNGS